MEESNEASRVLPELYFLVAKFLSGGPLKETAKTLLKELDTVEVLPRRLDWEGTEHTQSYEDLESQYQEVSWHRLARVCERALQLARRGNLDDPNQGGLSARLSLLSEALVIDRDVARYAWHRADHSTARQVARRELGVGPAALPASHHGRALFSPRMLAGLTLQRRTLGHLSAVYCVVFDCTGRYVITGADDMLVKMWSARDGRLVATLRGASAEVTDVCISAEGALVAAGSVDRLVRVWCTGSGATRAVLSAHAGTITSVHWAPGARRDLRRLATTSTDCSVAFWACSPDGRFLSQPVQYVERVRPGVCHMICAAWSAGGAFLAAGSADQHVRVYGVERAGGPQRVAEAAVHEDAVDSISWCHRGLRFVSGSKDGRAALWSLHATQWRHVLLTPKPDLPDTKKLKMTMVCWDSSDAFVLTAVSDNTVRVWCSTTYTQIQILRGHRDEAYVLEAHPWLAGVALSAGHDGQLLVWKVGSKTPLATFSNELPGRGPGALFDAKWGGTATIAATDSHGHLLLLGLGRGHRLFQHLPSELFFHTDYRPLEDEPPAEHGVLPPPFLVDVEGGPHAPEFQRLVPGRENLAHSQQIPTADVPRSQANPLAEVPGEAGRGPWGGEGVRYTAGRWQRAHPPLGPPVQSPLLDPPAPAVIEHALRACAELNALEQAWYRREMRRRPLMISTATEGGGARRAARRRGVPRPRAAPPSPPRVPVPPSPSATSDSSTDRSRAEHSDLDLDLDDSTSSSSSSQYSDWEAGVTLAPPARARRRPRRPAQRYSPSAANARRDRPPPGETPPLNAEPGASGDNENVAVPAAPLPEAYRPGEWITAVVPRKAPYHPQMGDQCLYFRLGHQRYFDAVSEKDVYKINPRDKPWERTHVYECELVKVVGIKYVIKPPRVASLRLACSLDSSAATPRTLTVRYHDMPDVIDFLVLQQQYDLAVSRQWGAGDRFRCMIDDSWWTGEVIERVGDGSGGVSELGVGLSGERAQQWAGAAAAYFLSLKVRWDNGEVERLSPWDLEPLDPERLPSVPGGAVPVLPRELDAVLYRATDQEWGGPRDEACQAIAEHIGTVMSVAAAEPFVAPVDLQQYPEYARVVPYPVDLATVRARCANLFYRRTAAVQFDVRYIATNAERFNEPHAIIIRQARLVTELLLHVVAHWSRCDVLAKYRQLSDTSRIEQAGRDRRHNAGRSGRGSTEDWRTTCTCVLTELMGSADCEPFRRPVSPTHAPDYLSVVSRPMDLGSVRAKLTGGQYTSGEQFARDVRLVFANSRLYNTNKRSRIYCMTVRLAALFEALWSRYNSRSTRVSRTSRTRPRNNKCHAIRTRLTTVDRSDSSDETLAATSRRVHAQRSSRTSRTSHGEAHTSHKGDDSWDSDAPLHVHTKGKGIGKKSKANSTRASIEPVPSTSRDTGRGVYNGRVVELGADSSSSSDRSRVEVLEEQLHDDVELTYTDSDQRYLPHSSARSGRKRRIPSDSSASGAPLRSFKHRRKPKRTRERFTVGSSSSSSLSWSSKEEGSEARRYESDRSYKPRYSTDDDTPLTCLRGTQNRDETAGVSLRRRAARRYNEDSEEDSAAAISKRSSHHALRTTHRQSGVHRVAPHTRDHNYFNGHATHLRNHVGTSNGDAEPSSSSVTSSRSPPPPVSISSRGRVRKLTPKARGLLHD